MNETDRRLQKLISLARDAAPVEPTPPEDVRFFAQHTVAAWQRRRIAGNAPDPWRLWEQVGNWSLAGAATALITIALLLPEPPLLNPLDVFGPVEVEEFNLF